MTDLTDTMKAEFEKIRDLVSADFNDKIKALDRKADEKWSEFEKSPDAVLGNSVKAILDERLKLADERRDTIEAKLSERMDEMEIAAKARGAAASEDPEAELMEAVKSFTWAPKSKNDTEVLDIPAKAVTTILTSLAHGAGFSNRAPGIREYPQRPLQLAELFLPGTIDDYYFKYERELAGSQEGGPDYQTEGSAKPDMDIYTEMVTEEVATIAVTARVSSQIFNDRSAFVSFLQGRMGYLTEQKLNDELLVGNGTGSNIGGINTLATAYGNSHVGLVTDAQKLDILRFAKHQVNDSNYMADFVVVDTLDWAAIEVLKDADKRYLVGDPRTGNAFQGNVGTLWGMNVISEQSQTLDAFTVGDGSAAQLFMREGLSVMASSEDQDNFVKNLVTLRAELRALLAVYSALAFVTGDFSNAIAAT